MIMKNVKASMKKKAVFLELDKFEELVEELTNGENTVYVEYGDVTLDDGVLEKIAEYYDVNITSIHADCCDVVGIWLIYDKESYI